MTIKMESATMMMMMMMIVTLVLTISTTKTWAKECGSVCLSDELAAIKETLKEMQHSIYANQFFIKRNWKEVSGAPPDFFCPKELPKSCYMFVEETKTWLGAQQYCMGKRAHLIAIESWEENIFIKNQLTGLNSNRAWWTGGSNDGVPGQWKWKIPAGKDEPLKYHDWDNRQPDNAGRKETVIEIWQAHHRWNDRVNTLKQYFICEYDVPTEQTYTGKLAGLKP